VHPKAVPILLHRQRRGLCLSSVHTLVPWLLCVQKMIDPSAAEFGRAEYSFQSRFEEQCGDLELGGHMAWEKNYIEPGFPRPMYRQFSRPRAARKSHSIAWSAVNYRAAHAASDASGIRCLGPWAHAQAATAGEWLAAASPVGCTITCKP
jgi:hypothetical protein